ncbi:MAG: hypothetical protein AB1609_16060 [Bacillota bacterium]
MTLADVRRELESRGVSVPLGTLGRWVHEGLMPGPERIRGGPGQRGRTGEYPHDTAAQAFATWTLLRKGTRVPVLREARAAALGAYRLGVVLAEAPEPWRHAPTITPDAVAALLIARGEAPEELRWLIDGLNVAVGHVALSPGVGGIALRWRYVRDAALHQWPAGLRVRQVFRLRGDGLYELVTEPAPEPWTLNLDALA